MKKRLFSVVLAIALVLGIAAVALAQGLTPSVDKAAIKAGESVTVSLTLEEAISDMASATFTVGFNGNLFELTGSNSASSNLSADLIKGTAPNNFLEINWFDFNLDQTLPAGVIMTLTFTAKSDIADESQAAFTSGLRECVMVPGTAEPAISANSVSVTVSPAGGDPTPTPTAEPSPTVEPTPTVDPTPTTDPTPTVEPTPTVDPTPTTDPTPTVEPTPTVAPTPTVEPTPTVAPTPTIAPIPTVKPTSNPGGRPGWPGSNVPTAPAAEMPVTGGEDNIILPIILLVAGVALFVAFKHKKKA